jgi:5-(carboxyamino)imidazole ribonucleotide mutase
MLSRYRTPPRMLAFAGGAVGAGYKVIIAGAGGATHLPGMIAAATTFAYRDRSPRLRLKLDGMDSLLSIVQMPSRIPAADWWRKLENAGLLAARIPGFR